MNANASLIESFASFVQTLDSHPTGGLLLLMMIIAIFLKYKSPPDSR